jgi:hypothetical protein
LAVSISMCGGAVPAAASTAIGQLDPGTPSTTCAGRSTWAQATEAAPSYVVPAGRWVLVSWSHRANSTAGRELGIRVLRPTGTAGTYTVVGAGALRVLTPGGINTFYDRIPVNPGEVLGLRVGNPPAGLDIIGGGAACAFSAALANSARMSVLPNEPAVGSNASLPASLSGYRLNVTARLEPDLDADGFGDETQDSCVGTAGSSSGCAPGADAPPSGKDTTPPAAKVTSRRDSIRDGRIAVWVTASETAAVTVRGTLSIGSHARAYRLRTATATVVANKRERILLRISKKARRVARRALRQRKRLRARVTVTLRDKAGNTGAARRSVQLKR